MLVAVGILCLGWIVEFLLLPTRAPPGSFICALEVILSATVAILLGKKFKLSPNTDYRRSFIFLILFFGFIGFADGAYFVVYYVLNWPRTSILSTLLTAVPYSLAYGCGALAMFRFGKSRFSLLTNWRASALSLALTLPILV